MRILIFISIFFVSNGVSACSEPIRFLYGPYVTLLMVQKILAPMHEQVAIKTGCEVEYTLSNGFEDLAIKLVELNHDYSLVPSSYSAFTLEKGYERFASVTVQNRFIYVVAKMDSPIHSMVDLAGRSLLSISPLSESGVAFEQQLKALGIREQVRIINGNNYEQNIFKVLTGQADAAIVISIYWDQLDDYMKTKKLKVVGKLRSNPAELVKRHGRVGMDDIVMSVLKEDERLNWEVADHELIYNQQLKDTLNKFIQSSIK